MTSRNDIIGQFLPNIYTRRITLEDGKASDSTGSRFSWFSGREPSSTIAPSNPDMNLSPATSITIDFNIKDVLDQSMLGIFTRSDKRAIEVDGKTYDFRYGTARGSAEVSNALSDPRSQQETIDEIASAMKIGIILTSTEAAAEIMYESLMRSHLVATNQSDYMSNEELANRGSFTNYLDYLAAGLNIGTEGVGVITSIQEAKPKVIGFEFPNSQFTQYSTNNDPMNIIPYQATFKVLNEEFYNCSNLSLLCFSFFDFETLFEKSSLTAQNMMDQTEIMRLSYLTGHVSFDVITRNNKVRPSTVSFRDQRTGVPYNGPVHLMGDTFMKGLTHTEGAGTLTRVTIPQTKIQDFRLVDRSKRTLFQPPNITQVGELGLADKSGLEASKRFTSKRYRDFVGVYNAYSVFNQQTQKANIKFSVNMAEVYRRKSKFSSIVDSMIKSGLMLDSLRTTADPYQVTSQNALIQAARATRNRAGEGIYAGFGDNTPTDLHYILNRVHVDSLELVRRRISTNYSDVNAFGSAKRGMYDLDQEVKVIAAKGKNTGCGYVVPQTTPGTFGAANFHFVDTQIKDEAHTNGVFEYGFRMVIRDHTKTFLIRELEICRDLIVELQDYLQIASIPRTDGFYNHRYDPVNAIGLEFDGDEAPDDQALRGSAGNYDRRTDTFTTQFRDKINQSPMQAKIFEPAVNMYCYLVALLFAKDSFSFTEGQDVPIQSNENVVTQQMTVNAAEVMKLTNEYDFSQAQEMYLNMLKPNNATPKTILNFINAFEEAVLSLENYLDLQYVEDGMNLEGSGYKAGAPTSDIIVERWLPEYRYRMVVRTEDEYFDGELTREGYDMRTYAYEVFNGQDNTTRIDFSKETEMAGMTYTYPFFTTRAEDNYNKGVYMFNHNESIIEDIYTAEQIGDYGYTQAKLYPARQAAPVVLMPQSLIVGENTLEVFFDRRIMESLYPPNLGGARITPYRTAIRNNGGVGSYAGMVNEQNNQPLPSSDPIPVLIETNEQMAIVEDFKTVTAEHQRQRGARSTQSMMFALDESVKQFAAGNVGYGISVDPETGNTKTNPEVFTLIENITNEMRDNSFQSSIPTPSTSEENSSSTPEPLVTPSRQITLGDSNECGLYDNRENINQSIQTERERFETEQGLNSFYQNITNFYSGTGYTPPPIRSQIIENIQDFMDEQPLPIGGAELMAVAFTPSNSNSPTRLMSAVDLQNITENGTLGLVPLSEVSSFDPRSDVYLPSVYDQTESSYEDSSEDQTAPESVSNPIYIPPSNNNIEVRVEDAEEDDSDEQNFEFNLAGLGFGSYTESIFQPPPDAREEAPVMRGLAAMIGFGMPGYSNSMNGFNTPSGESEEPEIDIASNNIFMFGMTPY